MKRGIFSVFLLCILCLAWTSYAAELSKLKMRILYVGYSPEKEIPAYSNRIAGHASEQRFTEDVRTRMKAFEGLLAHYFTDVSVVDARDYHQEMSREYDVTIFDALPAPVVRARDIRDENGKYLRTEPEKYLRPDYDCPTIFIAHTGGILQQGLNLKIDWCCLCLGAYAHHVRTEHEVFKGPFPVKLSFEQRQTPFTVYNYMSGYAQPDRLAMWQVQTSGYRDGKGQRVGLVSFGEGFDNFPDAEAIAGGESLKAANTVSIGRHGNFLLWGFAASPEDLTSEARTVFANCVAYISQFKGQRPVVHKYYGQPLTTREFVDNLLWVVSADGYKQYVHKKKLVNADREKQRQLAEKYFREKGELPDQEELDKKYAVSEILTREKFYRTFLGDELAKRAIEDRKACQQYISAQRPYFYGAGIFNRFVIDEDVALLKTANSDKYLLEQCIALWEKGENTELARRVLERYTEHQFRTPAEWRDWYDHHKELLFFTETGGYKFIENKQHIVAGATEFAIDSLPVQIIGKMVRKDAKKYISVTFRLRERYHIYGTLAPGSPFIPTTLVFEFPGSIQPVGLLEKPTEVLQEGGEGIMIYEKKAEFLQEIAGEGKGVIRCTVEYQCCNDMICMPPVKEEIQIGIE